MRAKVTEELRGRLYYDPDCGRLRWKISKGKMQKDKIAGTINSNGYGQVFCCGKKYSMHRVIYSLFNDDWPECVDHADRNPFNNDPENLRPATVSQNNQNRGVFRNNKAGFRGVKFLWDRRKWVVTIQVHGKKMHMGTHEILIDAVAARIRAEKKYHGEYAGHNA